MRKGDGVFWLTISVLVVALIASVYTIAYGIAEDNIRIWVAGLVLLGIVTGGSVRLYGHLKGPKP